MRLFQVIKRYLLIALLAVLIIGSIVIFFIFKVFMHHTTDETLYEYKTRVERYINMNDTLSIFKSALQTSSPIESKIIGPNDFYKQSIKDTLLYNEASGYFQPYRQLQFVAVYRNKPHLITISQPTIDLDDLFYVIIGSLISILSLLIGFTYLIDYYLKRKVWSQFYNTLEVLKEYDLDSGQKLNFEITGITEFDELNSTAQRMADKISADYQNLKFFTEDISHEMQTPLAIVKSKLEVLSQGEISYKESLTTIKVISNAISRLSKLSASLLLITKINNDQFSEVSLIDFNPLFKSFLESLDELIDMKGLILQEKLQQSEHYINNTLVDLLVSNILSNAIRHNVLNGYIKIELTEEHLLVENSCEDVDLNTIPNLFERLICKKSENSTGLGLSIVKSICDKSNIDVSYSYLSKDVFQLQLKFK